MNKNMYTSIVSYGIFLILVVTFFMLYFKADAVLLYCMILTLIDQCFLINIKNHVYITDIIIRFIIDILILYKINPDEDLRMIYLFIRIASLASEISMLITNNMMIILIYIGLSIASFVVLGYMLFKIDNLKYAIIFKAPIYLLGYLGKMEKNICITSSNIINKALYLFALNQLLKN